MRAIIYIAEEDDGDSHLDELVSYCISRNYDVVGVVHTLTGAEQMHDNDEYDVLVLGSRTHLPMRLEITTDEMLVRRHDPGPSAPPRRERPQRLQSSMHLMPPLIMAMTVIADWF